jgi:hypothetical protein
MDKLTDFLPLLVLLAISLVSQAFKPKKKKQETVFKPIVEEEPQPVVVARPARVVLQPQIKHQTIKNVTHQPVQKSQHVQKQPDAPIMIQEEEPETFFNLADADEIKKAVVYSEILNRKY